MSDLESRGETQGRLPGLGSSNLPTVLSILSLNFFLIVATTYSALGVVLPSMIGEFSWSWKDAGLGFTLLALFTGLCSPLAAFALRKLGARGTYGIGAALMAIGFYLLGETMTLLAFYVATTILGVGFAMLANVPGVAILSGWAHGNKRAIIVGTYLTIGGLGGVAGPLIANEVIGRVGEWRSFWQIASLTLAATGIFSVLLLRRSAEDREQSANQIAPEEQSGGVGQSLRTVLSSPPFWALTLALTTVFFGLLTVNSWLVTHLTSQGIAAAMAASAMSIMAAVNAGSRGLGGFISDHVGAKNLLILGLLAQAIAMGCLVLPPSFPLIILFACLQGFAFGMVFFSSTLVTVNFFGHERSAAILGLINMAATVAMLGPVLTGYIGDRFGSFDFAFMGFGVLALISVLFAMTALRKV